jgi:hypothetical protein
MINKCLRYYLLRPLYLHNQGITFNRLFKDEKELEDMLKNSVSKPIFVSSKTNQNLTLDLSSTSSHPARLAIDDVIEVYKTHKSEVSLYINSRDMNNSSANSISVITHCTHYLEVGRVENAQKTPTFTILILALANFVQSVKSFSRQIALLLLQSNSNCLPGI